MINVYLEVKKSKIKEYDAKLLSFGGFLVLGMFIEVDTLACQSSCLADIVFFFNIFTKVIIMQKNLPYIMLVWLHVNFLLDYLYFLFEKINNKVVIVVMQTSVCTSPISLLPSETLYNSSIKENKLLESYNIQIFWNILTIYLSIILSIGPSFFWRSNSNFVLSSGF